MENTKLKEDINSFAIDKGASDIEFIEEQERFQTKYMYKGSKYRSIYSHYNGSDLVDSDKERILDVFKRDLTENVNKKLTQSQCLKTNHI